MKTTYANILAIPSTTDHTFHRSLTVQHHRYWPCVANALNIKADVTGKLNIKLGMNL
ncbi:hypothetical protein [Pseudomonas mucidolens]|uniref:hypothetical protein n=1 Tax=Pseudomonas mucidolens TaxID=46679 RepID=UPI0030D74635